MYSQEQREVFRFWNGAKMVCADPHVLHRKLLTHIGTNVTLKDLLDRIHGDNDQLSIEASEQLLKAVRQSFALKELDEDGAGATEREQFKAFWEFVDYMNDLKKKDETSAKCSPSTEAESSPPPPVTSNTCHSG